MTPISIASRGVFSAGDELVATEPFLLRQGDDDAAKDAFAVLAARVECDGLADSGLAPRLVDMSVQAHHRLVGGDGVTDRGATDAGDDRGAALHDGTEVCVKLHRLIDR